VSVTPDDPAVQPPIAPGYDPHAPREQAVPAREVLPGGLRSRVARFDAVVDRQFDRIRGNPVADRIMYDASELADFSLLWHMIGVGRALVSTKREPEALRLAVVLAAESVLVNGVIKGLFRRSRPVVEQARPRRLRQPRSSSFPSGHASSGFTAAGLLAQQSRAWPAWYGLAALVASSRVHVKIHHASDVVGGVAVGLVLGRVARRAWPLPGKPGREE
jgi:undecaprenyl-diphosphatase